MTATLSFSLGDLLSAARRPPATQKPSPASEACLRKRRRELSCFKRGLLLRGMRGRNFALEPNGGLSPVWFIRSVAPLQEKFCRQRIAQTWRCAVAEFARIQQSAVIPRAL